MGNGNLWGNDTAESGGGGGAAGPTDAIPANLPPLSGNRNLDEAKLKAESYLGRPISDSEWDALVRTTFAEATSNPAERAAVMTVILNRVKSPNFPNTIDGVLNQKSQFQAVTGTRNDPGPSEGYTANRSPAQLASMADGLNTYLPEYADRGWVNFTSNIDAAYGAGTNIGFKDTVRNSPGAEIIGGTVFGSVGGSGSSNASVKPNTTPSPAPSASNAKLDRAAQIRTRIAEIDKQIEQAITPADVKKLVDERKVLEAELASLEASSPTEGTAGDPYSSYTTPQSDQSCSSTWDEPPSGYSARYPYNRVIQTATGHSIELDDTPGGERIMIWHRDGSYIQITGSSTSYKNMGDKYEVNERNSHVYIGGNNIVTIEGDSHVLIKGNKVEEIMGDYKQIVHGNIMVGGAGRVEINGADRTDIRSASLGLDSNVENLNIRTGKNIVFESGETISLKSKNIRMGASENMSVSGEKALYLQATSGDVHLKSKGNMFMNPDQNMYLKTEGGSVAIQSQGPLKMNSAGSFVSINSSSYMSLGAESTLMMASKGGSVNLTAAENMGLSATMMYVQGKTDVNIMAAGGQANIGASADITIASSGGNMFAQANGVVNVKGESAINIESTAAMNIKAEDLRIAGAATTQMKSNSVKIDGGIMSIKGETTYIEGAGNVNIRGSTVWIDNIVQLASGSAATAFTATAPGAADPGNEVKTKQEVQPASFDDAAAAAGGDTASQAKAAESPASAQSGSAGPPTPPDRHPPSLTKVFTMDDVTGIAPGFGPPLPVAEGPPVAPAFGLEDVR
jgi:spore germination cell wall hydrolase CwlJ-like protein